MDQTWRILALWRNIGRDGKPVRSQISDILLTNPKTLSGNIQASKQMMSYRSHNTRSLRRVRYQVWRQRIQLRAGTPMQCHWCHSPRVSCLEFANIFGTEQTNSRDFPKTFQRATPSTYPSVNARSCLRTRNAEESLASSSTEVNQGSWFIRQNGTGQ